MYLEVCFWRRRMIDRYPTYTGVPGFTPPNLFQNIRPSLSRSILGTIFGTVYCTSNCTSNRAKTSSKTRYDFGGFCTVSWYDLRYIQFMSDFYYFFLWYAPARQAAAAAKLTAAAVALPPPRCHCLRHRRAAETRQHRALA